MIYLISGAGAGQFAGITGNTESTLNLSETFRFAPDPTTRYMINNGKTVEITTTWEFRGKSYSESIESLIINHRNDADLGF